MRNRDHQPALNCAAHRPLTSNQFATINAAILSVQYKFLIARIQKNLVRAARKRTIPVALFWAAALSPTTGSLEHRRRCSQDPRSEPDCVRTQHSLQILSTPSPRRVVRSVACKRDQHHKPPASFWIQTTYTHALSNFPLLFLCIFAGLIDS